jgi:transposase
MYIRQTKTSSSASGAPYYTYRLVSSERSGGKVRQRTLLNLGGAFSVPREKWPQLCVRIEEILSGQLSLRPREVEVEELAQRYAAQLLASRQDTRQGKEETSGDYHEIDVNSLELIRPRSIGVEHIGLTALNWIGIPGTLKTLGFNSVEIAVAIGGIIGRMAEPGSELSTWQWLRERSGLGELMDFDYESLALMRLYRTSDLLVRHREEIEKALFSTIRNVFSLSTTVTLYDLTNTYFEGGMARNPKARRGRSKEKRGDCPLVTLGLVLDASGFVRRSRMFEGNISEAKTLESMLEELEAPRGAMVIMDRGIATKANIDWLIARKYRYLVVSRERMRQFDDARAVSICSASGQSIQVQRVVDEDGAEVRLYCHSGQRQEKEEAMTARFVKRFEDGLQKISESLAKPRGTKRRDKVLQRLGRLKERCRGIGEHYRIELTPDATGKKVVGLSWEKEPVNGSRLTHPGVYCLRTNELDWDEARLWRTYTTLTDLEAVFRSLKSELGLMPVYHHKENRAEGLLFITVLAYQAIQAIRRKLKHHGMNESWFSLRKVFSSQQRVTAVFKRRDEHTLHVRKSTIAESHLKELYDVLGVKAAAGGVRKMVV